MYSAIGSLIGIVVVIIIIIIFVAVNASKVKETETKASESAKLVADKLAAANFNPTSTHDAISYNANGKRGAVTFKMCIDSNAKRLAFIYLLDNATTYILDFDKIMSCEILTGGQSSDSFGMASGMNNMAYGVSSTTTNVEYLALKFTLKDINKPTFDIRLLNRTPTQHPSFVSFMQFAEKVKSVVDNIIENREKPVSEIKQEIPQNINTTEEIKKYKELFDGGIITQDEFDAKKKQLLGL